jgi:menaquinone-dependent protoporphyrinogen oxidase
MSVKLLIYKSTYGGTKKIVDEVADMLPEEVTVRPLEELEDRDIEEAQRIALGGAIHGGALQRDLKRFMEQKAELLGHRGLALFLCCMQREYAEEYFLREFPHELTGEAELRVCIGGDADPDRLNPVTRFILKRTTGSKERRQWRDREAMEKLVQFFVH